MPGHCEGSCTCLTGSAKTNFNILLDVLGLVKRLQRGSKSEVLSAAVDHTLLVGDETQALKNASFSLDVFSAVYFLLPREKNLLYVSRLNQEAMKTTLEGVRHFIIKDQFIADLRRCMVGAHGKVRSDRQYIGGKF